MPETDEDFLKRLLATFKVEAAEHVSAIFSGLIDLEKASAEEKKGIVEIIFREAHSLKGAARSVNLTSVESICQHLEGHFARFKRSEGELSPGVLDELHRLLDSLRQLLGLEETPSVTASAVGAPLPERTHAVVSRDALSAREDKPLSLETVRVPAARLDSLLLQVEELLSAKLAIEQHAAAVRRFCLSHTEWRKQWARVKPQLRFDGRIPQMNSEPKRLKEVLEWNEQFMKEMEDSARDLQKRIERDRRSLAAMVDTLLADMKMATMLPFSSLFDLLRKLVRDLSRDQGKLVELVLHGGDVELDRRILEGLKDPLVHLVRNSIDHGIESAPEREQKGKSGKGTVTIAVSRMDGKVEIRVEDDGRGIDAARVIAAATTAGLVQEEDAAQLNNAQAAELVFQSGVTTSPVLTDISGRGLGLAIVQEKVQKLGGVIRMESKPEVGTTFSMLLPLSWSTMRGVVVRCEERLFVLPSTAVMRVQRVRRAEVKTVNSRGTIGVDGEIIPLVRLASLLGIQRTHQTVAETLTVVIAGFGGERIAIEVYAVLQEQEVLLKNLGKQLVSVRNVAGATILGAGQVVPILSVPDLIQSAAGISQQETPEAPIPKKIQKQAILVVDDSITSRTLVRNILETNGYRVETAVDGLDGFTKLRAGNFALVVSDVEMPRMDGFALTEKIRREQRYAALPVVLVTGLASREDREHGMDVGANAYLVKSDFHQSNLLEVIERLI